MRQRRLERIDLAVAPGNDRDPGLLGQTLRADLVAQPAHRPAVGADDRHAEAFAQLGELGPLGDEPPAGPDRVGLRLRQRAFKHAVVEVGRAPQPVGVVDE